MNSINRLEELKKEFRDWQEQTIGPLDEVGCYLEEIRVEELLIKEFGANWRTDPKIQDN